MQSPQAPHEYLSEFVLHHIADADKWHLPFLPTFYIPQPLTLHTLMMIICSLFLIFLFCFLYRKNDRVPRGITNLLEVFVLFIRDQIAVPSLGEKDGRKMTGLFCTFFFFILGMNIMGLIPLFVTATANIGVTAGLALITLGFMIIGGIIKNGPKGFIKAFIPSGIPFPVNIFVIPLLFPIEFMGMFVRTFSLTIRLFANMLAGHIVLLSLISVLVLAGIKAAPIVLLILFMYLLEIMVAFLQAYIFTLFSAMFIGQIYHPDH